MKMVQMLPSEGLSSAKEVHLVIQICGVLDLITQESTGSPAVNRERKHL
jgi:hypothetical protein